MASQHRSPRQRFAESLQFEIVKMYSTASAPALAPCFGRMHSAPRHHHTSRPRHENLAQRTAAPIRIVDFKSSAASPHVLARPRFLRPCASRRARFANTLRPHFHHLKPCMSSAGSQAHISSGNPTPVFRFVSARSAPRTSRFSGTASRISHLHPLFSHGTRHHRTPPLPLVHLHDGALAVAIFACLALEHARLTALVILHHSHDVIHEPTPIKCHIARRASPPRHFFDVFVGRP
jgi:hypothetical protein